MCATRVSPCNTAAPAIYQSCTIIIPLAIECICEVRKLHSTACANCLTKWMQTMSNAIDTSNNKLLQGTLCLWLQSAMCYKKQNILLLATALRHVFAASICCYFDCSWLLPQLPSFESLTAVEGMHSLFQTARFFGRFHRLKGVQKIWRWLYLKSLGDNDCYPPS